jgi:hypothetical protein
MFAGVCPVIASENPVRVTTTFPEVNEPEPGVYIIPVPGTVGGIVSTTFTVLVV